MFIQKSRFLCNRSPSHFSDLQAAKNYHERIMDGVLEVETKLHQFPTILHRYLHVADKMRSEGLVPIVHGQALSWMVPQSILKAQEKKGLSRYRLWTEEQKKGEDTMRRMIQKEISSCQKLSHTQIRIKRWVGSFFSDKLSLSNQIHADHNNSIRPYLLAGTIGAFHNKLDESAFSLCFGCKTSYRPGIGATICRNIKGNRSVLSEEECLEISYAMIKNQMRKASDAQSLWEKIQPVYQSCHQVAIGQLIAIGIAEEKLDQHVYSCFAGGSPTGKLLSDLIRKPLEQNTVQVRIILDNQIMEDPSVEIVNIMDEKEVQEYCQHHSFQQEEIEQALEHLCKREQSMQKEESIEKAALTQIKEIQTKILEALSSL